jgi:NAD(P)-dependent dehydrogenase (short-subunit alcohol dehydrogenase family)
MVAVPNNSNEQEYSVQIALVTGGNRGLGFATARRLAKSVDHVIITSRQQQPGVEAVAQLVDEGFSASYVIMDVTDQGSVAAASRAIEHDHGKLDVLINNAGVLPEAVHADPAEIVDLEMFRTTYATNVFGPVAVLEVFLPLLRRSAAGRIVNVSSVMGSLVDQLNPASPYFQTVVPAYQSSKAALNNVTIALAKQLRDTPIKVTSVCPGFVQTDLAPAAREHAPSTADEASEIVYQAATLPDDAESGTFIGASGRLPW